MYCKQPCSSLLVRGDDNQDYALPVKHEICDSVARTFTAAQATGTAAIEIFDRINAIASEAWRVVEDLCRNAEAVVYVGTNVVYNRPRESSTEYGFEFGSIDVFYNDGETPIFETTMNCVKGCYFCQVGGANTSGMSNSTSAIETGRSMDDLGCNLSVRPIILSSEDNIEEEWTPPITETPVVNDLILVSTFNGYLTGKDSCEPPLVTIPSQRSAPTCEDASGAPQYNLPASLL